MNGECLSRRLCLSMGGSMVLGATLPAWARGATRLISVGGALTEVIYLLGAQGELVATDTTSLYPEAAQKTPKVGYFRQLSAEGMLSLNPGAVVATSEAGPPLVFEQLRAAGVPVHVVRATHDWSEVQAKVKAVGLVSGREAQAKALQNKLDARWQSVQAEVASRKGRRPKALFILAHGSTPSVAGEGTAADAMIRYIGCDNAMRGFKGYRGMTAEGMAQAAPDVLLTTIQGIEAQGGIERFWQRPGMSMVPAFRRRALVARDALEMMGFGPRLPQTVQALHWAAVQT